MIFEKIISGGQSGVDRGALDAALNLRFPCGGWCPPGRVAEDGPIDSRYPLKEMDKGGYDGRTKQNIIDATGTLIIYFGDLNGGTEHTVRYCILLKKPYKLIDATEVSVARAAVLIRQFIDKRSIRTLNVAGPRQSKASNASSYTLRAIEAVIRGVREIAAQQRVIPDRPASVASPLRQAGP